jgi:SAM-dependent methyltransferase
MTAINDPADDWSAVADAWDRGVDEVEGHIVTATHALVDRLAVRAGDRILELAAGPGTLGATWSQLTGPMGTVIVSDIAPGMVDAARRRNAHLPNVEVAVIDASFIDRPACSYDVVACRMGLMFTPDPAVAFGEIHRVLAPGGRFGALTWGAPEHNPWMTCVGMAAMINGHVSGGPPVGPGGIFSLGDPTDLEALAKGAGFIDVTLDEFHTTFQTETIDAHIEQVSSLAGPLAAAFSTASADQLTALRRTASQLAADYTTPDGVALPGKALLVTGHLSSDRRPSLTCVTTNPNTPAATTRHT